MPFQQALITKYEYEAVKNRTLSLPELSNVFPSWDNDNEVTVEKCFSNATTHFLLSKFQILTLPSSPPEKS
jgi:hypothetical protein